MTQTTETSWSGSSDADLLREFAQRRQEAAFAELVRRHGGMVLAVCRSVLGNTADAEDAAQAVFLTLARKGASRQVHGLPVGWLHRVAWYVASRAAEARAIRRRHEQEAARMKPAAPEEERIDPEALHAALALLPEKYRVPLLLHHLEGRSQEETAALMGCGVSAVGMRMSRARQLLRDKLRKRGILVSVGAVLAVLGAQSSASASTVFVAATAKAAAAALAGTAVSTAVTAHTLALSKGAMNMLFWAKTKMVAAVVAAVLVAGGTVGTVLVKTAGAADTPGLTGTITQIGDKSVSIQPKNGQPIAITINDSTVIKVSGQVAKVGDLKVGMSAAVIGDHLSIGQAATEIRAYPAQASPSPAPSASPAPQGSFAGTITQIGAGSITVQPNTGAAVTLAINDATKVQIGGKDAKVADLKVGMRAYGLAPTGQPVAWIHAYMPTTAPAPSAAPTAGLTGTITQVGDTSISIQPKTGQPIAITINASTVVKVNGQVAKVGDLKIGMNAAVIGQHLSRGDPANEVRAYTPK